MKSYREVPIQKDPKKERLKIIKGKLLTPGQNNKLTQKEIEDTLLDLIESLKIN